MGPDFVKNLPPEISIDILSRLPIPTILQCKCVCKSWLYLLESDEFVKTHLSKSVPGLAVSCADQRNYCSYSSHGSDCSGCKEISLCKIFEFDDRRDLEGHEFHYNLLVDFEFDYQVSVKGSVNGLLFVRYMWAEPSDLFIYNPITRDYIELDCPQDFVHESAIFGFGVSQMSGQYKVVRISWGGCKDEKTQKLVRIPKYECHVYILGTRSWRSIEHSNQLKYIGHYIKVGATFLNGNLHWLVDDLNGCTWISWFDVETEIFSIFSVPPPPRHEKYQRALTTLENCLCLCDNSSEDELVIWLMKEYGDGKSWTKEFIIKKGPHDFADLDFPVYPIKVFKDGDILIGCDFYWSVYFSMKTKTVNEINMFEMCSLGCMDAFLYKPSFLSLKSFPMESVSSF